MSDTSAHSLWSVCREGFRRNRVPALILQAFAALLLAVYFLAPELRPAFDAVERSKDFTPCRRICRSLFSTSSSASFPSCWCS